MSTKRGAWLEFVEGAGQRWRDALERVPSRWKLGVAGDEESEAEEHLDVDVARAFEGEAYLSVDVEGNGAREKVLEADDAADGREIREALTLPGVDIDDVEHAAKVRLHFLTLLSEVTAVAAVDPDGSAAPGPERLREVHTAENLAAIAEETPVLKQAE